MLNKKCIVYILFLINAVVSISCSSLETRIDDISRPVSAIQNAIFKSMPMGSPHVSSSKRKFTSKPFLFKGQQFVPASNSRERYIAVAEILGDRRPYSIYIQAIKTRRRGKSFYKVSTDQRVAQELSKVIQDRLSKSLKNGNVIDDFRVF